MKFKKEVFYFPLIIISIYLFEKIYWLFGKDRECHVIIEIISLFIIGALIGLDKNKIKIIGKSININMQRVIFFIIPNFIILFFSIGVWFILSLGMVDTLKIPKFISLLFVIPMYYQVGSVLLGYFITSSIVVKDK